MKMTQNLAGDEITLRLTPYEVGVIVNALEWQNMGISDRNKGIGKNEAVEAILGIAERMRSELQTILD